MRGDSPLDKTVPVPKLEEVPKPIDLPLNCHKGCGRKTTWVVQTLLGEYKAWCAECWYACDY